MTEGKPDLGKEPRRQEEGQGQGQGQGEEKFLAYASPEKGDHSVTVYTDEGSRTFYRDPSQHPEGSDAQLVTSEEFAAYNFEIGGARALAAREG